MPRVTAIMVTGKCEERRPLAYAAIASFARQHYEDSELLIVNDGRPLLDPADMPDWLKTKELLSPLAERVRELTLPRVGCLGRLRNIGLSHASGEFICQWDDDDWSHESRIAVQLAASSKFGRASLLKRQVRCNLLTGTAFKFTWPYRNPVGIPGTIMHPNGDVLLYREMARSEDDWFLRDYFPNPLVLDPVQAEPMYIRFYHGHNTWDAAHIIGRHHTDDGRVDLSEPECEYLRRVREQFYSVD